MQLRRPRPLALEALEDRLTPVSFSPGAGYTAGNNGQTVATGDLNGDGRADVLFGDAVGGMISYLSDAAGNLTQTDTVPLGDPRAAVLVDLNGDNKLDFLVANGAGLQAVSALGNGDGTFQSPVYTAVGGGSLSIAVADFDGDGRPDAAVADGGVAILHNTGTASVFAPAVQLAAGGDSESVATGDFNGDGKPDIVTGVYVGDQVEVLLNNGDGTFAAAVPYSLSWHGAGVVTGDFDGNGRDDIVVSYGNVGAFVVLLANPDGTFNPPTQYGIPGTPGGITVADFDLDGRLDLAVDDFGSSRAFVYAGNGDGTFGAPIQASTGINPSGAAVGDFNGDGLPDLVSANTTSPASITVALNTTAVSVASFAVSAPAGATSGQTVAVTVTARSGLGTTLANYTGTVHFTSTDGGAVLPADVTFAPGDHGVETVMVTLQTPGAQTVTATDTSTGASGVSGTISVITLAATPALTSNNNPALPNTPITFTFTLTPNLGTDPAPLGTVQFFDGPNPLGTAQNLAAGSASITAGAGGVPFLTVGPHTITAQYTPQVGAPYAATTATQMSVQLVTIVSTTTLTPLNGPSVFGDLVGFIAAVTPVGGLPFATGMFNFFNATTGAFLGSATISSLGQVAFGTTAIPLGTTTIRADYSGDDFYRASSGTAMQVMDRQTRTVVGSDAGPVATVQVFDGRTGALLQTLTPFDAYTLGVKVATGDVNNDGIADIIVSAGAGAPGGHVKVYSGANYAQIASFFTFRGFDGGVNVAVGDVNGDGYGDVVIGTAIANDHVKVFSGLGVIGSADPDGTHDSSTLMSFFAYSTSGGNTVGVTVGTGDVDGDGLADVITGSATFAGHVKVFQAMTAQLIGSYFAYGEGYLGGIYVAGGDLNGDGRAEIITGATNAPHVKALTLTGTELASFFAYTDPDGSPAPFGVRVGAVDRDGDGLVDILTGAGDSAPAVKVFSGLDPDQLIESFIAQAPGHAPSTSGIFVGGSRK